MMNNAAPRATRSTPFSICPQCPFANAAIRSPCRTVARREGHLRCRRLRHRLRQSRQVRRGASRPTATAPAVQKLLDAGARFVGKTQTDELAFSMLGQNVHFPHPVNPAAPGRVTGGSSSGSVAAVAGGLADIATGSDTGGSVRIPAALLRPDRTAHHAGPHIARRHHAAGPVLRHVRLVCPRRRDLRRCRRSAAGPGSPRDPTHKAAFASICSTNSSRGLPKPSNTGGWSASSRGVTGSPKRLAPPTQTTDELYWCMRKLQAREAWAAHGAWISGRERQARQGDRSIASNSAETVRRRRGDRAERPGATPSAPSFATCSATTASSSCRPCPALRRRATARPRNSRPSASAPSALLCWSGLSGFPQITLPLGEVDGAPFGISLLGPPDATAP